jgi:hypothetical protein
MVAFRPEISRLHEENQPKGFFEADQYRAVLENLPEYLKPVIQTAYTTGWRIKSEILSLNPKINQAARWYATRS